MSLAEPLSQCCQAVQTAVLWAPSTVARMPAWVGASALASAAPRSAASAIPSAMAAEAVHRREHHVLRRHRRRLSLRHRASALQERENLRRGGRELRQQCRDPAGKRRQRCEERQPEGMTEAVVNDLCGWRAVMAEPRHVADPVRKCRRVRAQAVPAWWRRENVVVGHRDQTPGPQVTREHCRPPRSISQMRFQIAGGAQPSGLSIVASSAIQLPPRLASR